MFIFRTFKSVRICVSLKLSKTLLFFGLKIANFCLKKRIIGYTHTREEEEEEEVCSLFLCHRVWFNTDLSEQGGFFTTREVRGVGFFRSRGDSFSLLVFSARGSRSFSGNAHW
jgi:hypothetical protein